MANLIQTNEYVTETQGERLLLDFLTRLPDNYIVIRELKIKDRLMETNSDRRTPDFILLSPETGIIILEVKDWNLMTNIYRAKNQYKYIKIRKLDGIQEQVNNPFEQARQYLYLINKLLSESGIDCPVREFAVFTKNTRNDFQQNILSNSPSALNDSMIFDEKAAIFKDNITGNYNNPVPYVNSLRSQLGGSVYPISKDVIDAVKNLLIPDYFMIGDIGKRMKYRENRHMLSEKQKRWIFQKRKEENFLFDIAGSGKTNCLISKAMHEVDISAGNTKILLTTYSENLKQSMKDILQQKSLVSETVNTYDAAISVLSLEDIYRIIIRNSFGETDTSSFNSSELQQLAIDSIKASNGINKVFDHAFIDEVQDFDTADLKIISCLLRTKSFFLVGDIGQKLLNKTFDLKKLGILPENVSLPKSYVMYRTPAKIARLAFNFLTQSDIIKEELVNEGYKYSQITYPNSFESTAEFYRVNDYRTEPVESIKKLLDMGYPEQEIMIICHTKVMEEISESLKCHGIKNSLNLYSSERIILADFSCIKGLERPIVLICGVDLLPDAGSEENLVKSEEEKKRIETQSIKIIYVALTRTTERLLFFYREQSPHITKLLRINSEISGVTA